MNIKFTQSIKYYPVFTSWVLLAIIVIACSACHADYAQSTARTPEFSNEQANVWKTVIYPKSNQVLSMHRHHYDRVLIALTNGTLKITNNQGQIHYLKLKKNKAYYLKKDPVDELHQDENITHHPITVMVIELKK